MKERINTAVEYLKSVGFQEPRNIRVEEIEGKDIVLSFELDTKFAWDKREYRRFSFLSEGLASQVSSMTCFNPHKT